MFDDTGNGPARCLWNCELRDTPSARFLERGGWKGHPKRRPREGHQILFGRQEENQDTGRSSFLNFEITRRGVSCGRLEGAAVQGKNTTEES